LINDFNIIFLTDYSQAKKQTPVWKKWPLSADASHFKNL